MHSLINLAISLLPVFAFLYVFFSLDSYKLIPPRSIVFAIVAGVAAALIAFVVNSMAQERIAFSGDTFPIYVAPFLEEFCKAVYIVILLRSAKIGFLVDASLYGIAVGAGFALIENLYYFDALSTSNILVWIIRGFGTAIMHGGVTALFAIVTKYLSDRNNSMNVRSMLPGYLLAVAIHAFFNHAFFPPVIMTLVILVFFPIVFVVVFRVSQKATKAWLRQGLDSDIEMLEILAENEISESRIGKYLRTLQSRFPGEVIGDMLCLFRLNLELSMHAKGILMMREAGIDPPEEPEILDKLKELEYLQRTIGKTGMLALTPFLPNTSQELWQINIVSKK